MNERESNLKRVILETLKINDAKDYEIKNVCKEILDDFEEER